MKHTSVFSHEEEKLWSEGVLGVDTPTVLLNALFFLNGKILCLRGGREHKQLKLSQFSFSTDSGGEYVTYTENGSKNRSGTYKDKPGDNKVVKQYSSADLGNKCCVSILKLYLSKLPPKVLKDKSSVFYWKAKEKIPYNADSPWFTSNPIGRNQLESMVGKMCGRIGIEGKTNYSLRATGTTRLFEANVPEKMIKNRTALRMYETSSVTQERAVSKILSDKDAKQFDSVVSESCTVNVDQVKLEQCNPIPSLFRNCTNCTINVTMK